MVVLGPWRARIDLDATAEKYLLMESGAASACMCLGCGNYLTVSPEAFPEEFARFLADIGVDRAKEVSVRRVAPLDAGNSLYAGSYAAVGKILEGPVNDAVDGWRLDVFETLGGTAHVALRMWEEPPWPWEAGNTVRIRFLMTLPWKGEDPSSPVYLSRCRGPADKPPSGSKG